MRDLIESAVLVLALLAYSLFNRQLAGKAYFIIPLLVGITIYLILTALSAPDNLKEFGIRTDNIRPSAFLSLYFFIPITAVLIITSLIRQSGALSGSFWAALLLYPIWGLFQQFAFQSILHNKLIKLGLAPWSIVIVAVVYAIIHFNSFYLMILSFFGGLIFAFIFLKHPNIIPLGIMQGLWGAIVYYMILGKDVMKDFNFR